ncbi:MAG: hypothetical protein DCF16_09465 [Alphaproteobacteria bacterium]|nr:MAG: hypothetical protein DCF16_09465 [Alphaproteobacteria bacterium]
MTDRIMLIGGPDSGKTNYLGRAWKKLRDGGGALSVATMPLDISYVEDALNHLLQGEFAPRSDKNLEEGGREFHVSVAHARGGCPVELVVPDVSGELWKRAVDSTEIPDAWMKQLEEAGGALLFVRIHSDQNVAPLDWVTQRKFLKHLGADGRTVEEYRVPTQVALCELIRFLEYTLAHDDERPPRVAVVVTAWDRLDAQTSDAGPDAFLRSEYPLFAGRITDTSLDVRVFGVSILGGDLDEASFKQQFLDGELEKAGYVVSHDEAGAQQRTTDISLPIAWVVEGMVSA